MAGFYADQRVVLLWDGLSAHWSTKMRAFLDSRRDWAAGLSGCPPTRPS